MGEWRELKAKRKKEYQEKVQKILATIGSHREKIWAAVLKITSYPGNAVKAVQLTRKIPGKVKKEILRKINQENQYFSRKSPATYNPCWEAIHHLPIDRLKEGWIASIFIVPLIRSDLYDWKYFLVAYLEKKSNIPFLSSGRVTGRFEISSLSEIYSDLGMLTNSFEHPDQYR